jgi:DNA-binding NarL/FixJ family response regulator
MAIRILIADDHQLFREGLVNLISRSSEMEIIGQAENGREVIEMAAELKPEVILMDIGMPEINGIDATRIIKKNHPNIKIVALSMHSDRQYIKGMLEAGASGYLLKNSTVDQAIEAVKLVNGGKKYLSTDITEALIENYLGKDKQSFIESTDLTQRELEILKLYAEGKETREIAKMLYLSVKTIGTHRQNILEKLGLRNTADMVKFALKHEIIDLD